MTEIDNGIRERMVEARMAIERERERESKDGATE
jgi:hypothetical protein